MLDILLAFFMFTSVCLCVVQAQQHDGLGDMYNNAVSAYNSNKLIKQISTVVAGALNTVTEWHSTPNLNTEGHSTQKPKVVIQRSETIIPTDTYERQLQETREHDERMAKMWTELIFACFLLVIAALVLMFVFDKMKDCCTFCYKQIKNNILRTIIIVLIVFVLGGTYATWLHLLVKLYTFCCKTFEYMLFYIDLFCKFEWVASFQCKHLIIIFIFHVVNEGITLLLLGHFDKYKKNLFTKTELGTLATKLCFEKRFYERYISSNIWNSRYRLFFQIFLTMLCPHTPHYVTSFFNDNYGILIVIALFVLFPGVYIRNLDNICIFSFVFELDYIIDVYSIFTETRERLKTIQKKRDINYSYETNEYWVCKWVFKVGVHGTIFAVCYFKHFQ